MRVERFISRLFFNEKVMIESRNGEKWGDRIIITFFFLNFL